MAPPAAIARPTMHVIADKHGEHEPTYCLYADLPNARGQSGHREVELVFTCREAAQLRDELTRWLDVTA